MPKKRKTLTPKSLGLVDDVKLSETYANSRNNFKTVSDCVIGYWFVSGQSHARIAPIYRAEIWLKEKSGRHLITTHEIGAYLNEGSWDDPDENGDSLAAIAWRAIQALERHAEIQRLTKKPKKRREAGNGEG